MRTSSRKLNPSLQRQIERTLAQLVSDIKEPKEAETFLKNFLTRAELEILSKRLAVAYWLKKKRSYSNIKTNLKVSSATIAEVSSNIKKGDFELAIKKIEAEEWANKWAEKIKKIW